MPNYFGFCYCCQPMPRIDSKKKREPLKRLARLEPGFAASGVCVDCAAYAKECEAAVKAYETDPV